jgi:hypothetical protein
LNRLPEVKAFIREDIPKYENVEFEQIAHHNPDLFLLNEAGQVVERIDLAEFSREKCNELLVEKGFSLKPEDVKASDEVPKSEL